MAFDQQVTCRLHGSINAIAVRQELAWASDTPNADLTSIDVGTWFNLNVWTILQPLLHTSYYLSYVTCEVNAVDPAFSDSAFDFLIDATGTDNSSEATSPFVAAKIIKKVDNTTIDPVGNKEFRDGSLSFGGLTENSVNAGRLTTTAMGLWQNVATVITSPVFATSGTSAAMQMFMYREPNTLVPPNPTRVNVYVDRCNARQQLGSQVSRKSF